MYGNSISRNKTHVMRNEYSQILYRKVPFMQFLLNMMARVLISTHPRAAHVRRKKG